MNQCLSRRAFAQACFATLLLGGCAQQPVTPARTDRSSALAWREPLQRFHLEGRIMVAADGRSFSGSLIWERDTPNAERMLLSGPLGQGAAEIRRTTEGNLEMRLADGSRIHSGDAESLLRAVTGVRLPEGALLHWLSAVPRPESAFFAAPGATGGLDWLEQDGWRIEYGRYRDLAGRPLPHRVFARQGEGIEFRLVIDRLETPPR